MTERNYTSWSEVDTVRQCLQKHHLKYKRGLTERQTPAALVRGSRWHELLEALYTTKEPEAPYEKLGEWRSEGVDHEEVDLLAWMVDGYYEAYGTGDPLWLANTRAVEVKFEVDLPDVGFGPLKLHGVVDLVVELWGKLWVVDHKSGKRAPKKRELDFLDQWTLYVYALRQLGYDVFGSVHSYAKTERLKRYQTLEERFERSPIDRTDLEVEKVVKECTTQAWLGRFDNGHPKSPGDHCVYRCSFSDYCLSDRRYGKDLAESVLRVSHVEKPGWGS